MKKKLFSIAILLLSASLHTHNFENLKVKNPRTIDTTKLCPKLFRFMLPFVTSLAISNDSNYFAVGLKDKSFCIWDIKNFKNFKKLENPLGESIERMVFNPQDESIAIASTNKLGLINLEKCTLNILCPTKKIDSIEFTSKGILEAFVIVNGNLEVWKWDGIKEAPIEKILIRKKQSPPCKKKTEGYIFVLDPIKKFYDDDYGRRRCSAHHPQTSLLAHAYDSRHNPIVLWDDETKEKVKELRNHKKGVNSLTFTPNGKYLVSSSTDGTIKVWELCFKTYNIKKC